MAVEAWAAFQRTGRNRSSWLSGATAMRVKYVAQVTERIDLVALAGRDQAGQDRRRGPAAIGAAEQPVFPADRHPPQGVLAGIVVDGQIAIGGIDAQGVPLVEGNPMAKSMSVHVAYPAIVLAWNTGSKMAVMTNAMIPPRTTIKDGPKIVVNAWIARSHSFS